MNYGQKLKKSGRTASLKLSKVDSVPETYFKNENRYQYFILTDFRQDIWQMIFFSVLTVCVMVINEFVRSTLRKENGRSTSQLQKSIVIFNITTLVKSPYLQTIFKDFEKMLT